MLGKYPYKRSLQSSPTRDRLAERDLTSGSNLPSTKVVKRIRGEIACAECRRLKIRCDKAVPCSTCVKRGCSALCPNGIIPPGDGSRFVLAATDHLRKTMMKLEARMHSLEDAIAIINTTTSDRPHTLLTSLEDEDDEEEPMLKPIAEETLTSAVADTLGSLHIDAHGAVRFFGPSGGSESLLLKAKELEMQTPFKAKGPRFQDLDPSYLPSEVAKCYQSFPFTPPGVVVSAVQFMIETFLPPMERAVELCDIFLEHLSWMFHVVSRQQMVKELIPIIYNRSHISYGPHDLALMLIVLGIGSLVDLDLEAYNLEAQHYYRLARATLALQPVLTHQSVVAIKVLHLMSIYNGMSGKESNLEQSYVLLDLASQVALTIGFHIDPSLWGFQGKEAYERRVYFWNLMSGACWQSLVTGRPPAMLVAHIDCRIPTAEEENLYQRGEVPLGFGIWGFRASVECLIPVVKAVLEVKPPSYQAVLELDSKIRNFTRPSDDNPHDDRTAISMQSFVRSHYQDLMLLFLHRGFFAQAMSEYPLDPLNSPLGPSVSAAYSSACVILDDTKSQFYQEALLCTRIWRIWSFAFSAAVIVGTVAARGVHLKLEPPAFEEFETACNMFRGAAETSSRAARAMPILQVMLQKAFQVRELYKQRHEPVLSENQPDDELSIFGGRTRLDNKLGQTPSPQMPDSSQTHPHDHSTDYPHSSEGTAGVDLATNLDDFQATFADLSGGWNGLFHEVPHPEGSGSYQPFGEGGMVDDRWSSFMHNYSILGQTTYPQVHS